jgi:drug/metabolite transporter (DMT)-like permease
MKTPSSHNIPSRSYLGIILAIFGWGLSTTFVGFGLEFINPLPFLALRFTTATVIISPLIIRTHLTEVRELVKNKWVWYIGISETVGLTFQYFGQQTIPAGLSSLLTMMNILLVPLLSFIVLNERFSMYNLLAIVLGLLGVFFIVTEGNMTNIQSGPLIGIIFLLGSAASYAIYQITTARLTKVEKQETNSLALFFLVMMIISTLSLIVSLIMSNFQIAVFINFKVEAWIWIIFLAIFSTIIAFTGHFESTKGISANTISILLLFQFLIPSFVDIILLDLSYSVWTVIGSITIVLAMVLVLKMPMQNYSQKEPVKSS